MLFFLTFLAFIYITYKFSTRTFNFWKKKGVDYVKPLPIIGNCLDLILFRTSLANWFLDICKKCKNKPYFGIWLFQEPCLVVLDHTTIKNVMAKDFSIFANRAVRYAPEIDPMMTEGLMFLPHSLWKKVRPQLSPIFNVGKVKRTVEIMDVCARPIKDYIVKKIKQNSLETSDENSWKHEENSWNLVEMNEIARTYLTKVSASIFFGLDVNCYKSEDCPFQRLSKKMFQFSFSAVLGQVSYVFDLSLVDLFKLRFLEKEVGNELKKYIAYSIEEREKSGEKKGDFVDHLIEIKKQASLTKNEVLTEDRILAQALAFFSGGFVTISSLISFALHELCLNQKLQQMARKEILEKVKSFGGASYEALQQMVFLEAIIYETLRKYPALPFVDRRCSEDYVIPGTDLTLPKGTRVIIPIIDVQYNPKYYPNPQKFDPYRFMGKVEEGTFLTFGYGPRTCLGKQYGLLIAKMAIVHILSEFEVNKCEETNDPVVFEKKSFFLESSNRAPMLIRSLKK